jgi:tetratricopeptide (TPR) repeat protein
MVELYPDGSRRHTPEVSELRLVYEQDLPPAPPTGVYAEAGDGQVRLYWNTVNEDDLGGYFVYYGTEPGSYHGRDSALGPSPIDVGRVSQVEVTGLSNSKLYYFAVVAYDATDPPHRSLFSREVSARPSFLGSVYDKLGKYDQAIRQIKQAIELKQDFTEAYNNLGVVLRKIDRFDEAIVAFRKALTLAPQRADIHYNLGNVYKSLAQDSQSLQEFSHALKLDPGFVPAYNNLGTVLERQNRFEEAIATYRRGLIWVLPFKNRENSRKPSRSFSKP